MQVGVGELLEVVLGGASGASGFSVIVVDWHVVVDHDVDSGDVDSSTEDVSGYHDSLLELLVVSVFPDSEGGGKEGFSLYKGTFLPVGGRSGWRWMGSCCPGGACLSGWLSRRT